MRAQGVVELDEAVDLTWRTRRLRAGRWQAKKTLSVWWKRSIFPQV